MVCALLLRKNFLNFKWWMPVSNCSTLEPREWIYSFIHSALKGCSHSEPGPHLEWKGRGSWCSHTHPYHFQTLAAVRSMLTGISTAWFHTRGSTVTQQNTCTSLSIAVRSMATQITYWMQSRQRKWFMFSVKAKCMFIIHSFVLSRYTLSVDLKHRRSIYSSQITLMQQTCMPGQACCQQQFIGSHTRSISLVTTNSRLGHEVYSHQVWGPHLTSENCFMELSPDAILGHPQIMIHNKYGMHAAIQATTLMP